MVEIDETPRKIKKFARRLRGIAARRQQLTDGEIEQFIVVIGLDRAWRAVDRLTAPPVRAEAE